VLPALAQELINWWIGGWRISSTCAGPDAARRCCSTRAVRYLTTLVLIGICPRAAFGNSPWKSNNVAGKVMSWVVFERAAQISRLTGFGEDEELVRWHAVAEVIHA